MSATLQKLRTTSEKRAAIKALLPITQQMADAKQRETEEVFRRTGLSRITTAVNGDYIYHSSENAACRIDDFLFDYLAFVEVRAALQNIVGCF